MVLAPRVVLVAFVGCLAISEDSSAQRRDTLVTHVGAPRHPAIATAVEDLSFGVVDGAAEYSFTAIADMAIGADQSILILDVPFPTGTPAIRLFDSRGRFVQSLGRVGGGPGEFRRPVAIAAMQDGRYLVLDQLNGRLTAYSSAGAYTESWQVPSYNVSLGAGARMRAHPAGLVAIRFTLASSPAFEREAVVRVRLGGGVVDTLPAPELPDIQQRVIVSRMQGSTRASTVLTVPYSPAALWTWSPHGYFVTTLTSHYSIDQLIPVGPLPFGRWHVGDPIRSLRASFRAVEVGSAERADQRAFTETTLRRLRGDPDRRLPDVPRTKPFIRQIFFGQDGRMWVWVHAPSVRTVSEELASGRRTVGWREPNLYDAFEPDGTYIGRALLPDDFFPMAFSGDSVLGVTPAEFGIPVVKRYRVQWR